MAERSQDTHAYDNDGELILTGSSNAYVAATARQITGYHQGLRICGKANHTNTGAATLNINGLGAVAIRKLTSVALVAGDMVSGQYYDLSYDFNNGWFQLLNPSVPVLPNGSVTNAMLANMAQSTIKGRAEGAGTGAPQDLTPEQARDVLALDTDDTPSFTGLNITGFRAFHLLGNSGTDGAGFTLIKPASGSSIDTEVLVDLNADRFRIFENGGSFRGAHIDITACAAGVGTSLLPTVATTQASTSGSTVDFSSIPTGVSRITLTLNAVSVSGSDNLLVQIGDSGGVENTGYVATSAVFGGGAATSTAGYILRSTAAGDSISGHVMLTRVSTTEWICSHTTRCNGSNIGFGGGTKALSAGPIDRVRLTLTGANSFDAGSVGLIYD